MPHSSGGGSHSGGSSYSGGSHSGGSHSGGSHSGSSYSSSSGGSSSPSVSFSRRPRPGAARYVYYDFRHRPHEYYVKGNLYKPDYFTDFIAFVIVMFVALCLASFFYDASVFIPAKTDTSRYDASIVLEDHTGLIGEDTQLLPAMEGVREATGVTPSVEIVYDSEWEPYYKNLETFALNEYLRFFDDEYHWLFIVSYPDDWADRDFVDWRWEGMIGDRVGKTVNSETEENCTKLIQKHLIRSTPQEAAAALTKAFTEFSGVIMTAQYHWFGLSIAAVIVLIGLGISWLAVADDFKSSRLLRDGVHVKTVARTYACEYCGSAIVEGSATNCPRCGAPQGKHAEKRAPRRTR